MRSNFLRMADVLDAADNVARCTCNTAIEQRELIDNFYSDIYTLVEQQAHPSVRERRTFSDFAGNEYLYTGIDYTKHPEKEHWVNEADVLALHKHYLQSNMFFCMNVVDEARTIAANATDQGEVAELHIVSSDSGASMGIMDRASGGLPRPGKSFVAAAPIK